MARLFLENGMHAEFIKLSVRMNNIGDTAAAPFGLVKNFQKF